MSGQDRAESADRIVRAKGGRPKKKPGYDKQKVNEEQIQEAVKLYEKPYDDRKYRDSDAPTITDVAKQLKTTTIRVRKMLVTAGYYSTATSRRVQKLNENGNSIHEIMKKTGLGEASVYSYLPYSRGLYNLEDPTLCAEQNRSFRARNHSVEDLAQHLDKDDVEEYLWKAIVAFEGYSFHAGEKQLSIRYKVQGDDLVFKKKVMSRTTVLKAFHEAREIQKTEGFVSGPRKLGTEGARYLYPVFLRIGVCKK